jgi:colanic acid/amylovoran biosynthesis glycosyltransferase
MSEKTTRSRPRILVLATTVPAHDDDGTPAFVVTLGQALSSENDVTILAPMVPGAAARELWGNLQIKRFRYFPKRFEKLAAGAIMPNLDAEPWRLVEVPPLVVGFLWSALREVRTARPDLVHAHWLLPSGLLALVVRGVFGIPYIVTTHAADVFRFRGGPSRALKRLILAKAAAACPVSSDTAAIVGISAEEAQQFVIPMGVDIESIQRSVGERAPEPGRFLFVGRLVQKKGLDVLIRALAEVSDAHLVVVGDGPERQDLERLVRELGIFHRVAFVGQQGHSRVAEELRVAHALVVPSRVAPDGDADATPVVMSEGMAAGVPVIASRLGGLSEHIVSGQNGLLVEPNDVQALAAALRKVLADPDEAARWTEAARSTMLEKLDIRATARRYQELITSALAPEEHSPARRLARTGARTK